MSVQMAAKATSRESDGKDTKRMSGRYSKELGR